MKTIAEVPDEAEPLAAAETLLEAIQLTIGQASVCWVPDTGAAVFDRNRAARIADDLHRWIVERYGHV